MGYTHYWDINRDVTPAERDLILSAANLVVKAKSGILAGGDGEGDPELGREGIVLNGRGKDSYETFALVFDRKGFDFCKTAQRPYDEVVVALLCIASHVAPDAFGVRSDGDVEEWGQGLKLAQLCLSSKVEIPAGVRRPEVRRPR